MSSVDRSPGPDIASAVNRASNVRCVDLLREADAPDLVALACESRTFSHANDLLLYGMAVLRPTRRLQAS